MHDHDSWNEDWLRYRPHHLKKLRHLYETFAFSGLDRGLRILDIGCGGGDFVALLVDRGFNQAAGWEPQPDLVKAAANPRITLGSCLDNAGQRDAWDVIAMLGVMHHLRSFSEVETCIATLHTLLKPGGLFFSYEQRRTVWRSLATMVLLHAPVALLPERLQLDRRMVQAEKTELDLWLGYETRCTAAFCAHGFTLERRRDDPLHRCLVFRKA
jgi:2-polyprenyl-3-methyl-5-hydroxy-6-metoxy-1,4-benzoquinol methylase